MALVSGMKVALDALLHSKAARTALSPRAARKAIVLCHSLLTHRGEVSGTRMADEALSLYRGMDQTARIEFFDGLSTEFSPDPEAVGQAGEAYRQDPSPANLARLQEVVEPPRQELFRRLNTAPGGTGTLVDLRGEILKSLSQKPAWEPISADLGHLFTSWFNRGFLSLRRIDWGSPAVVLERLIRYEAVHEIRGFTDLRRRLAADRRCYAFFHPALPDEPMIFIEVALTRGMSSTVQPLLDLEAPVLNPMIADSAIFYSITNCQKGLRGVPFGSFLIKQVAEDLSRDFPKIRRFATLSPVPGFAAWLKARPAFASLAEKLSQPLWHRNRPIAVEMEKALVPLCAQYLLKAKKGKEPLDSVARFHLRNGSELERINWLGDVSTAGLERSFGLMVNYVYRLSEIERNHERYTQRFNVCAASAVESLAKSAGLKFSVDNPC